MFFRVHIFYIEEGSAIYKWSPEQRDENLQLIIKTCEEYNFTYTIVPLEKVFDISEDIDLKRIDDDYAKIIEEEKKRDEEEHSVPNYSEDVKNTIVQVD